METYQHSIGSEISEIQKEYRTFQSDSKEVRESESTIAEQQKRFKGYLQNQEDPRNDAGKTDDLFYPYDVKGVPHIGTGHKLTNRELQDPKWSQGINAQQKSELFDKDIKTARNTAKGKYGTGWKNLKERHRIALTDYSFIGHSGKNNPTGKTVLDAKIRAGKSDSEISSEFSNTTDTKRRNTGRTTLYSDLINISKRNKEGIIKRMSDVHVKFMETHGVKSLESRHNIPEEYGKQIIDQQIAQVKKFDKENISIKDMNEFNRLIARQLGSLGLKD
mgnify:CR=1 FL=1